MGKNSRSGSGMKIPDHISESFVTTFWVKNTKILWCESGSGIRIFLPWIWDIKILIQNKHPRSATLAVAYRYVNTRTRWEGKIRHLDSGESVSQLIVSAYELSPVMGVDGSGYGPILDSLARSDSDLTFLTRISGQFLQIFLQNGLFRS